VHCGQWLSLDETSHSLSSSVNSGKNYPRMTGIYLSQLIILLKKKKQVQQSFLHLQHTRHQFSLNGAGLRGLDVDCVKSSSDYFAYLCIPSSETTLHWKRMSHSTTDLETNYKNESC
jgi:hypothetical protein